MISDYTILAVRNLRKRKLRSWLTMLGIFISIATIFTLISVSLGLQQAVQEQFNILGADKFFILPKGSAAGPGSASASPITSLDVEVIEKIVGIKDYSYVVVDSVTVESSNEKRFLTTIAFPADHDKVFKELSTYSIDEGKFPREQDSNKIFLGSQFKYNSVFSKPIRAGDKLIINGIEFKISAIMSSLGDPTNDKSVYMFMHDFEKISNKTDIDEIIVQIDSGTDINEVAERTEKKLRSSRGETEKTQTFMVSTPEELLATIGTVLNIITAFLIGVAAISLLVGAIGIANTMYTSVLERTKEIGVMKAVGAQNKDILMIFLIESGLLGLTGGAIGVFLGAIASKTIAYIATVQLGTTLLRSVIPLWLVLGCLAFSFLIGALSGTIPAYQASKTKPVDALRYE
jgi:putative ABC transport system permease protein